MLIEAENNTILYFTSELTYIKVKKGTMYNTPIEGRKTFERGEMTMQALESEFLKEHPEYKTSG